MTLSRQCHMYFLVGDGGRYVGEATRGVARQCVLVKLHLCVRDLCLPWPTMLVILCLFIAAFSARSGDYSDY